jgi:hypothetical protein
VIRDGLSQATENIEYLGISESSDKQWLGRQDSNLGMSVPKTDALPLGDAPIAVRVACAARY